MAAARTVRSRTNRKPDSNFVKMNNPMAHEAAGVHELIDSIASPADKPAVLAAGSESD